MFSILNFFLRKSVAGLVKEADTKRNEVEFVEKDGGFFNGFFNFVGQTAVQTFSLQRSSPNTKTSKNLQGISNSVKVGMAATVIGFAFSKKDKDIIAKKNNPGTTRTGTQTGGGR